MLAPEGTGRAPEAHLAAGGQEQGPSCQHLRHREALERQQRSFRVHLDRHHASTGAARRAARRLQHGFRAVMAAVRRDMAQALPGGRAGLPRRAAQPSLHLSARGTAIVPICAGVPIHIKAALFSSNHRTRGHTDSRTYFSHQSHKGPRHNGT